VIAAADQVGQLRRRNLRLGFALVGVLIGLFAVAICGVIVLN